MKSQRPPRFLSQILSGLLFFCFGVGVCGLFSLKNKMHAEWLGALERFQWLVMVEGDQIQVDEAGRFLRQIEGVSEVNYVSPEEMLERVKSDPDLSQGLAFVEDNPFPQSWSVKWKPDMLEPNEMQDALTDVRTFPGIVDVAYDRAALQSVHYFRVHWYQVKTVLSLLVLGLVLFASILFGFFLFTSNLRRVDFRSVFLGLFIDEFFWALGFAAVCNLFGRLPLVLLGGGVVLGLCRLAWTSLFWKNV